MAADEKENGGGMSNLLTSPGYGVYIGYDRDDNDNPIITNRGTSAVEEDGDFCPECLKNSFYNWVGFGKKCHKHNLKFQSKFLQVDEK